MQLICRTCGIPTGEENFTEHCGVVMCDACFLTIYHVVVDKVKQNFDIKHKTEENGND